MRARLDCLLFLLASALAQAAGPTYRLDCLPDNASQSQIDMLHLRLELHGWREVAKAADYRLCFQTGSRQEIVTDPLPMNAPYWLPPPTRVRLIPTLRLRADSSHQPRWQAEQDLDAEGGLEGAVEQLIDRLPLSAEDPAE